MTSAPSPETMPGRSRHQGWPTQPRQILYLVAAGFDVALSCVANGLAEFPGHFAYHFWLAPNGREQQRDHLWSCSPIRHDPPDHLRRKGIQVACRQRNCLTLDERDESVATPKLDGAIVLDHRHPGDRIHVGPGDKLEHPWRDCCLRADDSRLIARHSDLTLVETINFTPGVMFLATILY
jgi:hypothetical protein